MVYTNFATTTTTTTVVTTVTYADLSVGFDKPYPATYNPGETVHIDGGFSTPSCTWTYTSGGQGSGLAVDIGIYGPGGSLVGGATTSPAAAGYKSYAYDYVLSGSAVAGKYDVVVSYHYPCGGFIVYGTGRFFVSSSVTTIVVTSPATTTEWTWTVSGMGGIEGRVTGLDIFGNRVALAGAVVEAKGQQTFTTQTSDDGSFHLAVPPDNYVVTASANGYAPKSGSVIIAEGWKASIDFLLTPTVTVSTVVTTTVSPATTLTTLVASTTLSTVVTVYTTVGTGGTVTGLVQGLVMQVSSNSSVSNLVFDSSRNLLNFTVSGPAGTYGFFDAAIAKSLLLGQPVILIDGVEHAASVTEDANFWYIHVAYPHSAHQVAIGGSNTIPEFPSITIFAVIFVFAIIVFKRRTRRISSR
jgi:hypothetical protein